MRKVRDANCQKVQIYSKPESIHLTFSKAKSHFNEIILSTSSSFLIENIEVARRSMLIIYVQAHFRNQEKITLLVHYFYIAEYFFKMSVWTENIFIFSIVFRREGKHIIITIILHCETYII